MGGGGGKGATVGVGCHERFETPELNTSTAACIAAGAEDPEIRLFQFKFVADVGADSKLGSWAATL